MEMHEMSNISTSDRGASPVLHGRLPTMRHGLGTHVKRHGLAGGVSIGKVKEFAVGVGIGLLILAAYEGGKRALRWYRKRQEEDEIPEEIR
jgi:hypothetical protein